MYYIYHVPGKKIGCSKEPENRVAKQGFSNFEILETHEDGWIAGDREIELQKEYGYPVDKVHYMISIQNRPKGFVDPSAAGKKGYIAAGWNTPEIKAKQHRYVKESLAKRDWKAHNKKVTQSQLKNGTHPSQQIGNCEKCGRQIKGIGSLARHQKLCNK